MAPASNPSGHATTAIRGPVLTYTGDPFKNGLEHTMVYESDAIVAMADGMITHFGPADKIQPQLPAGTPIRNYGRDSLISAGFIDSHVHFPQVPMIAAYGEQLLDWLNTYTFPSEAEFRDADHATRMADAFLKLLLSHGTTSAVAFCSRKTFATSRAKSLSEYFCSVG